MLDEVATSEIDGDNIVSPIRFLLKRTGFVEGLVDAIDFEARQVVVRRGLDDRKRELPFDHLLIALGSETNFFGNTHLSERAVQMKSLADAILLHNRLIALLEAANFTDDEEERRRLLTVVVAGGGFSGVETIGAINDFLREGVRFYPKLKEEMLRVMLVHAGEVILPELGERLAVTRRRNSLRAGSRSCFELLTLTFGLFWLRRCSRLPDAQPDRLADREIVSSAPLGNGSCAVASWIWVHCSGFFALRSLQLG